MTTGIMRAALALPALLWAGAALGQWSLNNDRSTMRFVTIKAEHTAEIHYFERLRGFIDEDGAVEIRVELASVNTLVPIRDERMREMLFRTGVFPDATITGRVDIDAIAAWPAGDSALMEMRFDLEINGERRAYLADLLVVRLGDGVLVSTARPVIVDAGSHGLVAGVEALREVVGLPGISRAVPVTLVMVFERDR